ncbi:MAG: hypothetical protein M3Z02_03565 [Actinomycetota bacterium]|nr:hypothetical protein [Actinomycetota bacterium]
MSCQHLVCAVCAGPVADGRCPTCRVSRAHVHERDGLAISPQLLALLVALVAVLALAASRFAG